MNKKPQHYFGVITIFPEMFHAFTQSGVCGRAVKEGVVNCSFFNPRDYSHLPNRRVDDKPYGGGPGMVMMVQPMRDAIKAAKAKLGEGAKVIYLSPDGRPLKQKNVVNLAQNKRLILLSGRYEGIDERIRVKDVDETWSIGDYILSGGEIPAMVLMDAITRLAPGVLGEPESLAVESFTQARLEYPHYTRPAEYEGQMVPSVLQSGSHAAIKAWRQKMALGKTWRQRPDLLINLSAADKALLKAYIKEHNNE